ATNSKRIVLNVSKGTANSIAYPATAFGVGGNISGVRHPREGVDESCYKLSSCISARRSALSAAFAQRNPGNPHPFVPYVRFDRPVPVTNQSAQVSETARCTRAYSSSKSPGAETTVSARFGGPPSGP